VSPSMVQTVGGGLLVSPSLAQTVGLADCIGLHNPHSCRYCGTKPGFDFLLVSLTWFKPRERLSLANRWMCQYPYGKNTGVRTMVQTGGKVTCRNPSSCHCRGANPSSCRYRWLKQGWQPWCEVQPRVATPWCEVQTRVATTRVVIRGGRRTVRAVLLLGGECKPRYNHWVKTRVATALSPQQEVLSSVACAWFGLLPKGCRSRVEVSVEH